MSDSGSEAKVSQPHPPPPPPPAAGGCFDLEDDSDSAAMIPFHSPPKKKTKLPETDHQDDFHSCNEDDIQSKIRRHASNGGGLKSQQHFRQYGAIKLSVRPSPPSPFACDDLQSYTGNNNSPQPPLYEIEIAVPSEESEGNVVEEGSNLHENINALVATIIGDKSLSEEEILNAVIGIQKDLDEVNNEGEDGDEDEGGGDGKSFHGVYYYYYFKMISNTNTLSHPQDMTSATMIMMVLAIISSAPPIISFFRRLSLLPLI